MYLEFSDLSTGLVSITACLCRVACNWNDTFLRNPQRSMLFPEQLSQYAVLIHNGHPYILMMTMEQPNTHTHCTIQPKQRFCRTGLLLSSIVCRSIIKADIRGCGVGVYCAIFVAGRVLHQTAPRSAPNATARMMRR